jgi:calcineurin-like phosphoesterase family protein
MSKIYFTSDYHFGHANMINYCHRPQYDNSLIFLNRQFKNKEIAIKKVEEMNNFIIHNHNMVVKEDDMVFHIGDFCFFNTHGGKCGEGESLKYTDYLKKLNGNIILISGNHESHNGTPNLIKSIKIEYGGYLINLVHDPCHANFNFSINLTGHVHKQWKVKKLVSGKKYTWCINVGIDVWDYKPIDINQIIARYNKYCL